MNFIWNFLKIELEVFGRRKYPFMMSLCIENISLSDELGCTTLYQEFEEQMRGFAAGDKWAYNLLQLHTTANWSYSQFRVAS